MSPVSMANAAEFGAKCSISSGGQTYSAAIAFDPQDPKTIQARPTIKYAVEHWINNPGDDESSGDEDLRKRATAGDPAVQDRATQIIVIEQTAQFRCQGALACEVSPSCCKSGGDCSAAVQGADIRLVWPRDVNAAFKKSVSTTSTRIKSILAETDPKVIRSKVGNQEDFLITQRPKQVHQDMNDLEDDMRESMGKPRQNHGAGTGQGQDQDQSDNSAPVSQNDGKTSQSPAGDPSSSASTKDDAAFK
jgi:hypothetical protein